MSRLLDATKGSNIQIRNVPLKAMQKEAAHYLTRPSYVFEQVASMHVFEVGLDFGGEM